MRIKLPILTLLFSTVFACLSVNAQYENLSFELGDFTNWEGYTWQYESRLDEPTTIPEKGIVNRRHTIIKDLTAYDTNTGNQLKLIPPGYNYSIRLGDVTRISDSTVRNWRQSLQYTMTVDSLNPLLIIKFALVAKNHLLHNPDGEQRFRFNILDQNDNVISTCSNFESHPSGTVLNDFEVYVPPDQDWSQEVLIGWRDWTTVATNLSEFIGQTITLEFLSEDCILPDPSMHDDWTTCFGYAYFVTSCHPLNIKQNNCNNEFQASLVAPGGFEDYRWTDMEGHVVGSQQTLVVDNPPSNSVYSCLLTSIIGCQYTLRSKAVAHSIVADFSALPSCDSNFVQFNNSSYTSAGFLFYTWDFGDGFISTDSIPDFTFNNSGKHKVTLYVTNSLSGCMSEMTKEVESFSLLTIGIKGDTTYCPGESVWLKAYGTSNYMWSNGANADSIEVSAPGGEFWMIGSSSDGRCSTDTIYRFVGEEPDWPFILEGDSVLCEGEESQLTAIGSYKQIWSTGDEEVSIVVSDSGTYSCMGQNVRGCKKLSVMHVIKSPLPLVSFLLSDSVINSRANEITATAEPIPNIQYNWDMGDESNSETGTFVTHNYDYSIPGKIYFCSLIATNEYGCTNKMSKEIEVVPFTPNVFTPNNDGINDIFMQGVELEVFDRQGKLFYKGFEGWDGTFKGQPADQDTYFYSISFKFNNVETHIKTGYVTLMR